MGRSSPLRAGFLVAVLWLLLQAAIWTACAAATLFLSVLLVMLLSIPLTQTPPF